MYDEQRPVMSMLSQLEGLGQVTIFRFQPLRSNFEKFLLCLDFRSSSSTTLNQDCRLLDRWYLHIFTRQDVRPQHIKY